MSAEWIEALKKENEQLKKELEEYKHILDSNQANIHPDSVVITEKEYRRLLSVESGLRYEKDRYKEALKEIVNFDGIMTYQYMLGIVKEALGDE